MTQAARDREQSGGSKPAGASPALLLLLTAVLAIPAASLRASDPRAKRFPDTSQRVALFAPALPNGLTRAQLRFAATHLAGGEQLSGPDTSFIRSINGDFLSLLARPAFLASARPQYMGDGWGSDWTDIASRGDWFVRADDGRPLWHLIESAYLMDPSGAFGGNSDDGWKEYWAESTLQQMKRMGADGVRATGTSLETVSESLLDPPDPRFGPARVNETWLPQVVRFLQYVKGRFSAEPMDFLVVNDGGSFYRGGRAIDFTTADAVVVKDFAGAEAPGQLLSEVEWKRQMNQVLALQRMGTAALCRSHLSDASDGTARLFRFGSYILVKSQAAFFYLQSRPGVSLEYYPEYEAELGRYLTAPTSDVDIFYRPAWGVYVREYQHGMVLVNPTGGARTIKLDRTFLQLAAHGRGEVDADGMPRGTLTYIPVDAIDLGPRSAAILLSPGLTSVSSAIPAQSIRAVHRAGQTFITWAEAPDIEGEAYHLYRHVEPITADNLSYAQRLTGRWGPIKEGSAQYQTERHRAGNAVQQNYIIEDRGAQLTDGTGLFVHTPYDAGPHYYAVTVVVRDIERILLVAGQSATIEPVIEEISDPRPILVWESASGHGRVYTQFMDYEAWNPTYDGQYAYNYWIGVPPSYSASGKERLPLCLRMLGYGARYQQMDATPDGWPAIEIWADDPRQSWYFGYSAGYDYGRAGIPNAGPILNFTEERILRSIYDAIRDPFYRVDEDRIYAYGHSMGGTGALALGMRYPNVFAAVYASAPLTNFSTAGDAGGPSWRDDVIKKWGSPESALPVLVRGRFADHLQKYNGMSVWDWQNHLKQLAERRADEMAFLSVANGILDDVVEWKTQGRPIYAALEAGNHAYSAVATLAGHGYQFFAGTGLNWSWNAFNFRKTGGMMAFSNASTNSPILPDGLGSYNQTLEWSSSGNSFGLPIIDEVDRLEVTLRSRNGTARCDLTPRRRQSFSPPGGATCFWSLNSVGQNRPLAIGTAIVSPDGILTLRDLTIPPQAARLTISVRSEPALAPARFSPKRW